MSDDYVKKPFVEKRGALPPSRGAPSKRRPPRSERRVPVEGNITIELLPQRNDPNQDRTTWTGRIIDMSRKGMQIAISAKYAASMKIRNRLGIYGSKTCLISSLRRFEAEAVVRNKEQIPGNGTFAIGLSLQGMSELNRDRIERALKIFRKRVEAQKQAAQNNGGARRRK